MIVNNDDSLYIEILCDYCKEATTVIKKVSYYGRNKSLCDKDACRKCIGKKITESKAKIRENLIEIDGYTSPYRLIPIYGGSFALVDQDNYDKLITIRWYLSSRGHVIGRIPQDKSYKMILMCRFVMSLPPMKFSIEYINGDKLDNRELNLKIVQRTIDTKPLNKTSIHRGVSFHKPSGKWEVRIKVDSKLIRIGLFSNEAAGANAYNFFASHYFGQYACLNEVPFMKENEWRSYITGKQPVLN
jgi:hypothetical protein